MQRTHPRLIALAILLAALAGFVDALAYSSLGGFFASFMSGNTTHLGVAIANSDYGVGMTALALILSFVAGVIVATVISRAWPARAQGAIMSVVTLLLATAALIGSFAPSPQLLLLLAAAMGVENGLFIRDGEVSIGLTYMTGSLVRMAQRLAGALMGDRERWAWVPYLLLWLGFLAGVVMGARCYLIWHWTALWLAAAGAAALTGVVAALTAPKLKPAQ